MDKNTRFTTMSVFIALVFGYLGYKLGGLIGLLIGISSSFVFLKWMIYPLIYQTDKNSKVDK